MSSKEEKPPLRIRMVMRFVVLLLVIGAVIAGMTVWIQKGIKDTKKTQTEIYQSVQSGKVNMQTLDILKYGEDLPFGEDTSTEPRLLKHAGFTKKDIRSYDVYFLDRRGVKQNLLVEGVEVYTDTVKRPVMKAYLYKGVYWNVVLYVPKKEVTE